MPHRPRSRGDKSRGWGELGELHFMEPRAAGGLSGVWATPCVPQSLDVGTSCSSRVTLVPAHRMRYVPRSFPEPPMAAGGPEVFQKCPKASVLSLGLLLFLSQVAQIWSLPLVLQKPPEWHGVRVRSLVLPSPPPV